MKYSFHRLQHDTAIHGDIARVIRVCFFGLTLSLPGSLTAQWTIQTSPTSERLRAVSAFSANICWASGNHGTVLRTTDGGSTWSLRNVPGSDSLDFRDIEAVDGNGAYALSIGPGDRSRIYKTLDGGETWTEQYRADDPGIFLDEFAFWDAYNGMAVGDEIAGRLVILRTSDGGNHWRRLPAEGSPVAIPGEGAFAASGSGIAVSGDSCVWIGTGVKSARVFRSIDRGNSWLVATSPIANNNESSGIFSIAFFDARDGAAVGGDYRMERDIRDNAAITTDGGRTWSLADQHPPSGFRSGVVYLSRDSLLAVGPSGTDVSIDGGRTWNSLGSPGFHAVSCSKDRKGIWAVGEKGRIARYGGIPSRN